MTNLPRLLPLLLITQPLVAQPGEDHPRPAKGLPILYRVGGTTIEVPLGTRLLAWKPEPSRELTADLLEPPRRGDDMIVDDLPEGDTDPIHVRFRGHALRSECFDLWVYGDITAEKRSIWLLAALSSKVDSVKDRGLSAAEAEKLILAGRGDIKHFFDRVEDRRPEFEAIRKDLIEGHAFLRTLQPLSVEFQLGLFDFNSLFSKTLKKIENDRKKSGQAAGWVPQPIGLSGDRDEARVAARHDVRAAVEATKRFRECRTPDGSNVRRMIGEGRGF